MWPTTLKNILVVLSLTLIFFTTGCKSSKQVQSPEPPMMVSTNEQLQGKSIELTFEKGPEHNHPLMAIWLEDTSGNFLQTLYIAESIGKGIFKHGDASSGKWMPGPIRRPAAVPVWAHKRGIKAEDGLYMPSVKNPVADAVTGATPPGNFVLTSKVIPDAPDVVKIFFEINQTWDFNEYWTNNKYPDNDEYKTSCQPALVYSTTIDLNQKGTIYQLELIGHSHYAGEDGTIYPDVSTFTTALEISKNISVLVK